MPDRSDQISEEVHASLDLATRTFVDVFFGSEASGRPLIIHLDSKKVRFIRLTNRGHSLLHLGSLYAETASGTCATDQALLELSSSHESMKQAVIDRSFFKRGYSGLGIHTNDEPNPWAVVDLTQCFELSRIEINNWEPWSQRSWGLSIDVSEDSVQWTNIYDHSNAIGLFRDSIAHRSLVAPVGLSKPVVDFIGMLTYHVVSRDANAASANLRRSSLFSDSEKRIISNIFNERFLYPKQLEWTTHGFSRTFRFWTDQEKHKYLRFTEQVVKELKAITPFASMGFGSVLGLVRDQDFIPHDDDMDIIVAFPYEKIKFYEDAFALIFKTFSDIGYEVFGDYFSHRHIRKKGERTLDVFVGFIEGESVSWYPSLHNNLLLDDVFPAVKMEVLGVVCDVPRNPFRYLQATYGPDWNKPISNWHHPWDKSAFTKFSRG